jgi:hypothetical protein
VFLIYSNDVLIGRSALEKGDPPMGIALGDFTPTSAFETVRTTVDVASKTEEVRVFSGLRVSMSDGSAVVCSHVAVLEVGEFAAPLGWEVECMGFENPSYANLFPHHVKDYEDAMRGTR